MCRQLAQGLWALVLSVTMTLGAQLAENATAVSIVLCFFTDTTQILSEVDTCPALKLPLPTFLKAGPPLSCHCHVEQTLQGRLWMLPS